MKPINTSGKRKRSIARAVLKEGKGTVRVNKKLLNSIEPKLARLKLEEPLILAGDVANKVTINISVRGGGVMSQAEASRVALCRALDQYSSPLKKRFLEYDRSFLVSDMRRKEVSKPNRHGQARAKVQKSYR
jgi:small subunit ribosomal protein S9